MGRAGLGRVVGDVKPRKVWWSGVGCGVAELKIPRPPAARSRGPLGRGGWRRRARRGLHVATG